MRATEGVSGMIPRQEYEILAFMHEFYRWPEILRMTTDEVGAQGILDIGATARREIGTKVNCVHDWCIGAVGFGMGRCGLLALEVDRARRLHRGEQRSSSSSCSGSCGASGRTATSSTRRTATAARSTSPTSSTRSSDQTRELRAGQPEARLLHPVQRRRRAAGVPRPLRLPARARRHRTVRVARRQHPHSPGPVRQRGGLPLERCLRRRGPAALPTRWRVVIDPELTGAARRSGSTTSPPRSPGRRTTSPPSSAARSSPARSGTPRWARSTRSRSTTSART